MNSIHKTIFATLFTITLPACAMIQATQTDFVECDTGSKPWELNDLCGAGRCIGMTREEIYAKIGRPQKVYDDIGKQTRKKVIVEQYMAVAQKQMRTTLPEKVFGEEKWVTRESMAPYCYRLYLSYYPDKDMVVGVSSTGW